MLLSSGGDGLLAALAAQLGGDGCGCIASAAIALHASLPPAAAADAAWQLATVLVALLRPLRAAVASASDDVAAAALPGSAAFAARAPVYRRYALGEALPRLLARLPDPRAVRAAAWRRAGADMADAALRDAALALALCLLRALWAAAPPHAFAHALRAWAAGEAAPGGDDVAALARAELRAAQEAAAQETPDEADAAFLSADADGEPGWTLRGLLGGGAGAAPAAVSRKRAAAAAAEDGEAGPRAWQRRPRLQL